MSEADTPVTRLRLGQWFALTTGLVAIVALLGIGFGLYTLQRLSDARSLLADRLDPAATAALRLEAAMLNEETGVRGYLLTGAENFLGPWSAGRTEQRRAQAQLTAYASGTGVQQLRADLADIDRGTAAWVDGYALPTIRRVQRRGHVAPGAAELDAGKTRFDALRAVLDHTQANLLRARTVARARLSDSATTVTIVFVAFGALLAIAVIATIVTLRRVAILPIGRLAKDVRDVARGDFEHPVGVEAAREIVELGQDIDRMRQRIVAEAAELQRSNAELEQFAYVASHDLQEPLRKVASFCQLLQTRYGGQLDERADQYIAYAVDGAKRMQILINDLLAFSRVGRGGDPMTRVDLGSVVRAAETNLAGRIEEASATVEVGELPTVEGEPGLLTLVFQNLIANAIKFRSEAPPHVRISSARDDESGAWRITVRDNGIGIDPEYSERIFVIFQRLHTRASYDGTGIGLAMCRKIVEYHGGRIWLSSNGESGGSSFTMSFPPIADTEETSA